MADASAPAAKPKFSWAAVAKAPAPPAPAPAAPAASDMDEEIIEAEELRSTAAGVAFFRADAAEPADDGAKTSERASGGAKPSFPALGAAAASLPMDEVRSIRVPQHRLTPLKESWEAIVKPVVDHMKLQIRMNTKARAVEIKNGPFTADIGALQKAEDFVRAFMLGFDLADAVALLRLDDLYVETFEVTDVKMLKGDHLGRAIGRIAGIGGKTRHAIENATRTRIVVADAKIHILGAFSNIQVCRDAVCALILGSPPGKVYNQMRQVAARLAGKL